MKDASKKKTPKQVSPNLKIRLPKEFEKTLLRKTYQSVEHSLSIEDRKWFDTKYRTSSLPDLIRALEAWSPQSILRSGVVDIDEFYAKYQVHAVIRKVRSNVMSSKEKRSKAISDLMDAEQLCRLYNRSAAPFSVLAEKARSGIVDHVKRFIVQVIGESPPDVLQLRCKHGPGSSLNTKDGRICEFYKLTDLPYSVTHTALPLAKHLISSDPRWLGALDDWYRTNYSNPYVPISVPDFWDKIFNVVEGNRITTVPKDWEKDRPIAIEPLMNLFLQLGVDDFIRRRLKRFGVDLDSQKWNQELAELYSLFWLEEEESGATLDLKGASESVSLRICEELLPPLWNSFLLDLRSPKGTLPDGSEIVYEKISSMGNGFTFALESLIFRAIIEGVVRNHNDRNWHKPEKQVDPRKRVAVYGDDLIVPSCLVHDTTLMLHYAGFKLNENKSFSKGPFRESCGADFYSGTPLRPLFVKEVPNDLSRLYTIINRFSFTASRNSDKMSSGDCTFLPVLNWLSKYLPGVIQVGPLSNESFSSHLHVEQDSPRRLEYRLFYKNGLYSYPMLVFMPRQYEPKKDTFFFGCLLYKGLAEEREHIPVLSKLGFEDFRISSRGTVFNITQRDKGHYKIVRHKTSHWSSTYDHSDPSHPWSGLDR